MFIPNNIWPEFKCECNGACSNTLLHRCKRHLDSFKLGLWSSNGISLKKRINSKLENIKVTVYKHRKQIRE